MAFQRENPDVLVLTSLNSFHFCLVTCFLTRDFLDLMYGKSLGPLSKVLVGVEPDMRAFTGNIWEASKDSFNNPVHNQTPTSIGTEVSGARFGTGIDLVGNVARLQSLTLILIIKWPLQSYDVYKSWKHHHYRSVPLWPQLRIIKRLDDISTVLPQAYMEVSLKFKFPAFANSTSDVCQESTVCWLRCKKENKCNAKKSNSSNCFRKLFHQMLGQSFWWNTFHHNSHTVAKFDRLWKGFVLYNI